jgi:hypothetical protein
LAHVGDPAILSVDTADCAPPSMLRFRQLNPFHVDPTWRLVVPGHPDPSCSVEAAWQGTKLVDGRTELSMFGGRAEKRPPEARRVEAYRYEDSTFLLGSAVVDLVTARYLIYVPVYLQVLERWADGAVIEEISSAMADGMTVEFYDWDDNFDLDDPRSSFSHSALLATCFAGHVRDLWERVVARASAHPQLRLGVDVERLAWRFADLSGTSIP